MFKRRMKAPSTIAIMPSNESGVQYILFKMLKSIISFLKVKVLIMLKSSDYVFPSNFVF